MAAGFHFPFDNSYARLPARLYARASPTPVRAPEVLKVNWALVRALGIDVGDASSDPYGQARLFSGNELPAGADPIALAYAGHQFGSFVPSLGDGRAILLGEVVGKDGKRYDIQLKGAGPTPFSRRGDGRAAEGPVLREYIVSEAMAALGIPTTRALASVRTGESVFRERALPGAVLTRVASSHLRVGTFEYFAARRDSEALSVLVDYALQRHYPHALDADNRPFALLREVSAAHARLVAAWLSVGFVHGVMNTDNTSISGETLDYGPCAFLDTYVPNQKWSAIDHGGRYAFNNQPLVAQWNLARFAETLLPLLATDEDVAIRLATDELLRVREDFDREIRHAMHRKLGLVATEDGDADLAEELLSHLHAESVDYTLFFRRLSDASLGPSHDEAVAALFRNAAPFRTWVLRWRERLAREPPTETDLRTRMQRINPAFIPRNHRIEQAIAAAEQGDLSPFEDLMTVLARPYDDQPLFAHLAAPPSSGEEVRTTFCGT